MAEWVVVTLSPQAEGDEPAVIRASIRHYLRGAEVFLPVSTTELGQDKVYTWLVDGYAFVRRDYPDDKFQRLEGTKYVHSVVTTTRGSHRHPSKALAVIHDKDIDRMKSQITAAEDQGIRVDDHVLIVSGPYRNLHATVIEDIPEMDSVQVYVHLRSHESMVTLPRSFLRLVGKPKVPIWTQKFQTIQNAVRQVHTLMAWKTPSSNRIVSDWSVIKALTAYHIRGRDLCRGIVTLKDPDLVAPDPSTYQTLHGWVRTGTSLTLGLKTVQRPDFSVPNSTRYRSIDTLIQRWVEILDAMEPLLPKYRVLIDGMNMACRCSMAPGLRDLKDKRGRPTGAILGVLNSLGALRAKFRDASIHWVWDGSSQRRRDLFSGYKSTRNSIKPTFETQWLKDNLAALNVEQVYHPREEADDVLATLAVTTFPSDEITIVSTDKDLLQLVSPRVKVWSPVTSTLFGPDEVRSQFGVSPEQMVHLRALVGDPSDEIPGIPGCGYKRAAALLSVYGTTDALMSSNMAGVSKSMYQALKAGRYDIERNVLLGRLVSDLQDLVTTPPSPDSGQIQKNLADLEIQSAKILASCFPTQVRLHGST